MVPYKRPAADKSGVPVYQPNATTYQQLMQLQQPFVPVSCEYSTSPMPQQQQSSSTSASPSLSDTAQSAPTIPHQNLSPPLPQQNNKKESETIPITTTTTIPALPPQPALPDPATLAKEVAQQNYAKAVKLAAVNQSLANQSFVASQFSHLNPLNYTGISLNKQALAMPPPAAAAVAAAAAYPRYSTLPFQFNPAATPNLNFGLTNPYQAAIAQQNLLNISRPPPNLQFNPYALIRHTYAPTASAAAAPIYGNSLLNAAAQYPVTVSAAPMTNVSSGGPVTTNIAVAPQNNNNNNVILQPYKKLKTN